MNLFIKLRQLQFPSEFRIYSNETNNNVETEYEKLILSLKEFQKDKTQNEAFDNKKIDKLLAEISTGLWRLKNKMISQQSKQPLTEMTKAYRHLDSVWAVVEQFGVEILDHDGEVFDSGKSIKALAFEPKSGIERETIIETVKPSIYLNKRCIQMGEVIVGKP